MLNLYLGYLEYKNTVSVIIPTYNEEKNIKRLLLSLKNQTYKKIEVIVVDDGSCDKTVEISKRFADRVYEREHAERSIQRNFGAQKSKGEYLLFLDADMELHKRVIEDCVDTVTSLGLKALVIPEKTVGKGFIPAVRKFEREMYLGEPEYEVARFFERDVFFEFGGYDPKLTGPEDYDLPYRISKKYKIGRAKEYILHHEEGLTLARLLAKKYYYAKNGVYYAKKHPRLVFTQGAILFRKVYLKNWRKFVRKPLIGLAFIFVRLLETIWALAGFISEVGILGFLKTLISAADK